MLLLEPAVSSAYLHAYGLFWCYILNLQAHNKDLHMQTDSQKTSTRHRQYYLLNIYLI